MNEKGKWVAVFGFSAVAAILLAKLLFPELIRQIAAGIVAFAVFLAGLIFRRKR